MGFFEDFFKAASYGGASKMYTRVKVKKGETLSSIAQNNGVTLKQLLKLNPRFETGQKDKKGTLNQKTITPGTSIKVPDPHTFKKFKLLSTKKPDTVYKNVSKKEFKEMNTPKGKLKKSKGGIIRGKK